MENTYLLALDGDVDFRPEAVRLLVDRMKKNKKVGAACGRIHPIGSGMIYFSFQIHFYPLSNFKVRLFGIKNSSMLLVIGFKKQPNIF
jgi:chitin synthase